MVVPVALVCLTACGKKGALLYPDMLVPSAPAALAAYQSGSSVKLQFNLPDSDRAGRKLNDLSGVRISRLVSESSAGPVCGACVTDYQLFRTIYLDLLSDTSGRSGNRMLVIDGEVNGGSTYTYSVVPFTKAGSLGSASAPVSASVVPALAAPSLQGVSFPTEIKLTFAGVPPRNGAIIGYNLYRSSVAGRFPLFPITSEPLTAHEYLDRRLTRNTRYYYSARTVIKLASGALIESAPSQVVSGMLQDDEG